MNTDELKDTRKNLAEYLLAGKLPSASLSLLQQEQELLCVYCDSGRLRKNLSLTIARFYATDEMENTVIRWLQRIVGEIAAFPVQLRRYGGLSSSSIYLEAAASDSLAAFASHLAPIDSYVQSYDCPPLHVCRQPHVMMIADLTAREYEQTFMNFRLRKFSEEFMLSDLLLLRREPGTNEYKQVVVLGLQPQRHQIGV